MTQHNFPDDWPRRGAIVAVDYGTVRIGLAVADVRRPMAAPLETYQRSGPVADARKFRKLSEEYEVARYVVGLPVHLDGGESQKSTEARAFGRWLAELTGVPVVFFDERYTTNQAEQLLAEWGLTKKRRKARLDALAAQIMLEAYLESVGSGGEGIQPLGDR